MPNKLVFHLLWSCWRHLPAAREITEDTAVLSWSISLLCHPGWLREVFQHPGLKHRMSGLYFPKDSLSISLPRVYMALCVRALGHQGALLKGLTDLGETL